MILQFQLRYCPALSQKPPAQSDPQSSNNEAVSRKRNPFADPSPELLILRIPHDAVVPTHNLILNKYPVIPQHFILATSKYKAQTNLLEEADLEATWRVLKAWEIEERESSGKDGQSGNSEITNSGRKTRLFAFFNSGPFSGASQGHRHLQFLPVREMEDQHMDGSDLNGEVGSRWRPLVDCLGETVTASDLPFRCFYTRLEGEMTAGNLLQTYLALYHAAIATVNAHRQHQGTVESEFPKSTLGTSSEISYNLAMTSNKMAICPRWSEGLDITAASTSIDWKEGDAIGKIELNGTILAGTLMVKTEKEWDYLRQNEEGGSLGHILSAIGIPRDPVAKPLSTADERREHEHL